MQWINIKNYIPRSEKHVLVFIPDEGISVKRLDKSIYSDEIVWTYDDGEYENSANSVTHWMPLPEVPHVD